MSRSTSYLAYCILLVALLILPGCSSGEKDMQAQSRMLEHFSSYYPNVSFLIEMSGGECKFDSKGYMAARPVVWAQTASAKAGSVDGVLDAIDGNSFLIVKSMQDNIAVIKWDGVSSNILGVHLDQMVFPESDRYSAHRSLEILLGQKAILQAAKIKNMRMGLRFSSLAGDLATDGPSMDSKINDVSVESALLRILKTFRGGIIYTECVRPGGGMMFNVGYYPPAESAT